MATQQEYKGDRLIFCALMNINLSPLAEKSSLKLSTSLPKWLPLASGLEIGNIIEFECARIDHGDSI